MTLHFPKIQLKKIIVNANTQNGKTIQLAK